MIRMLASVLLPLVLCCCSNVCDRRGVEGTYEITSNGIHYLLRLSDNGSGTLAASGDLVGPLRWALTSTPDEQGIEISASGNVFKSLIGINSHLNRESRASSFTTGLLVPSAQCSRTGRLEKVILSYDEGLEFLRIE